MSYNINDNCWQCGNCAPKCPTGAISQLDGGEYVIDSEVCNNCEGYYPEPQCIVHCPNSSPTPVKAKKGRYKIVERKTATWDLFFQKNHVYFASAMVIWEACKILTSPTLLPWVEGGSQGLVYNKTVKQGRGNLQFKLKNHEVDGGNYIKDLEELEKIDLRSSCMHLLYAACVMNLNEAWSETFTVTDEQIEHYLGLDKRKDLTKATKLSLIKTLVQEPCQINVAINWPRQGRIPQINLPEEPIWQLLETQHYFQEDEIGCKHLIGLTFKLKAGNWSQYFLNKEGYQQKTAFYQYGLLPEFVLKTVMSIWQQHQGAARLILWLLFKTKLGIKNCIKVSTLMTVAYGHQTINEACVHREKRHRLMKRFESDLEILQEHQIQPIFDPVTYPEEIQPLWAKLEDIPDDPDEAIDFWINDGAQACRLTDSGPRDKWKFLMQARILDFDLPGEWATTIKKFKQKKQQKIAKRQKKVVQPGLSSQEIHTFRKKLGISQRKLAMMMGKSQSWIRDLENGRFSPKSEDLVKLQEIFQSG